MGRTTNAKDKKAQRNAELQKALEVQKRLKEAREAPDVLEDFAAFRHYDRRGLSAALEYSHAASLSAELRDSIFSLCKENMETQYASAWGWNDVAKRKELQSSDARFLLVFQPTKAGRDLVAFVHLRFENEAGAAVLYIYEIQLKDCVQRKGLGKFLMQLVELIGRKRGMEALMLTVLEVSEGAVKFYSQLGFKTDASSPGVEDWEDGRPPGYRILSKSINDPRKAQPVLRDANGGAALAAHASVPAAASS